MILKLDENAEKYPFYCLDAVRIKAYKCNTRCQFFTKLSECFCHVCVNQNTFIDNLTVLDESSSENLKLKEKGGGCVCVGVILQKC